MAAIVARPRHCGRSRSCALQLRWLAALVAAAAACAAVEDEGHPLRLAVVALLPASNSPALDLMGVAQQLHARGHDVLVVASTREAFEHLQRAAARHSSASNGSASSGSSGSSGSGIAYAAAAPPSAAQAAADAARSARAMAHRSGWRVPSSALRRARLGAELVLAMQESMAGQCGSVLADAALMQRLRAFRPHALLPLVLLPTSPSLARDSAGCVLSHALGGVPVVEVDAPLATLWAGPPGTPQFGLGFAPHDLCPSWRCWRAWGLNLAAWSLMQLLPAWADTRPRPREGTSYDALRAAHGLPRAASARAGVNALWRLQGVETRRCEVLLRVLPATRLLEYPRSLPPNHVLVGMGSPRLPHARSAQHRNDSAAAAAPAATAAAAAGAAGAGAGQCSAAGAAASCSGGGGLPPELAAFADGATSGLVLAGFGTGAVSADGWWLQRSDFEALARGFAGLAPVRVLWHLQGGLPAGTEGIALGANTLVAAGWVDYNDVLGHPETRAFVTHCGLHSAHEGLFHGVPLVGLPFMFEQVHTCSKVAARGAALVSPHAPAFADAGGLTHQHVTQLVREVLSRPRYAAAAAAMSHALQRYAAQRHPYARAADEVELALRGAQLARHWRPGGGPADDG